jgi:PAS domain S-box-containing protein
VSWVTVLWSLIVSACLTLAGIYCLRVSHKTRDALRESEARLRESEARTRLAFDAADVGIWTCHLTRNEVWASDKWRELFGFGSSDPLDFDAIVQRVHPDDRERLRQAHTLAAHNENDGRYDDQYRLVLPNVPTRWVALRGRVERDSSGQPFLLRCAASDITTHKNAELAVRDFSSRLLSAQEDERRRIARELHDNLSQQMAVLAMGIDRVALTPNEPPAAIARSFDELRRLAAEISTQIHNLSHRLYSSKLEMLGLAAAVNGHCREISTPALAVRFHQENVPGLLPRDVQLCLFRVVQEALNNVIRHSESREAHVTLSGTKDAVLLRVSDTGRGFDEREALQRGVGLVSMRERLRMVEGDLTIQSRPGHGTTVIARVPIGARAVKAPTSA